MLQHSVHIERLERLRSPPQRIMLHILTRTNVPRSKQVRLPSAQKFMVHGGGSYSIILRGRHNDEMIPVLLLNELEQRILLY